MRQIIGPNIHAALICPNPKDGTSLYRGHGPFGRLARTEPSLHLHTGTPEAGGGVKWSWTDFVGVDIAILQRPAAPPHVAVAQMAKDAGIPLWVDFDDDVTVVPISNRYHASFPKAQTEQCISQLVEMADVVTVTTEALAQRFKCKSRIIPNALDDFAVGFSEKRRNRVIAWRGSNTHDADLDTVMSSLSYHCANADWRWWFYGDPGWRLAKAMTSERVRIGPAWTDWRTMMSNLEDVAPYLWVVPLEDNPFNKAKCLVGNTRVPTTSGIKQISQIQKGDTVRRGGKSSKVVETFMYPGRDTIKITTSRGYQIEGTEEHRIIVGGNLMKLQSIQIGDVVNIEPCEISENDYQTVPIDCVKYQRTIGNRGADELLPKVTITERWGEFIGIVLGDGSISSKNDIAIAMAQTDTEMIEWVNKFATDLGLHVWSSKRPPNSLSMVIGSTVVRNFLAHRLGMRPINEKKLCVPEVIWKSPKSVIAAFLRGCFETDGTVECSGLSFCSKQESLAKELQILLLGFGIQSKMKGGFNQKYRKTYYKLMLGRQAADLYQEHIGFISKRKAKALGEICAKPHSNAYSEWDWHDEVISIEKGKADVFDVEVEDEHMYTANGFASHNSNCAWLEATAVGAAVLAPALTEWDRPGIETYRNEKEFDYKLRRMMSAFDGTLHPNVALSREYIRSNLLLSEVNQKRAELLVELTSKNPLKSKIKP